MILEEKKDHSIRLKKVVQYSGRRLNAFAKHIGYSNGSVLYNVTHGRNGISASLADRIVKKYSEISLNWLLNGEGEMLINKEEPREDLVKKIETLEEIIKGHSARLAAIEGCLKGNLFYK